MIPTLIICITIIILALIAKKLYTEITNVYVDEPVEQGDIFNDRTQNKVGEWVRYKRTHKNGKITYHEIRYK